MREKKILPNTKILSIHINIIISVHEINYITVLKIGL